MEKESERQGGVETGDGDDKVTEGTEGGKQILMTGEQHHSRDKDESRHNSPRQCSVYTWHTSS